MRAFELLTMSYTNLIYHIVFRTYRSEPTIKGENERELYAYIMGTINNLKGKLYRIGGMPDHIHMLVSVPPTMALSEFMRRVKRSSSEWLKTNAHFPGFAGWGQSFAAFTYSRAYIPAVKNYIINQKSHHQSVTLENELCELMTKEGVTIDEYFLKD